MALTASRYIGRDVTINVNGALGATEWESIDIELSIEVQESKGAGSDVVERVVKAKDAKISVKGLVNVNHNLANLPAVGAALTTLAYTAGADSLLPSSFTTDFPASSWVVISVKTTQSDNPADWSMDLVPNVLNAS